MSPYREIDHTADWALDVWAPTLEQLFVEAARGMYALAGVTPGDGPRAERPVALTGGDAESLLVGWLQELLYFTESEGLAFDAFEIARLTATALEAKAMGALAAHPEQAIKAVTYHNLAIRSTEFGHSVTLVFDV